MFNVSEIAIFILATVTMNGNYHIGQRYPTYWESRILPIKQTWGSFFPQLYFVLGRSHYDHRFLKKRCSLVSASGDIQSISSRAWRNSTDYYKCDIRPKERKWNRDKTINSSSPSYIVQRYNDYYRLREQPVKVLYTANCTGTYFGIGPTCRCQETLRYFMTNTSFSHVKWFAFMDDDLYYQPYSLLSFMNKITQDMTFQSHPLALVAGFGLRGFSQFKNKLTTDGIHHCTNETIHRFMYAQPAFMNRMAIERLRISIDHNSLSSLHRYWGGSHDSLLGLLFWMYRLQIYGASRITYGAPVYVPGRGKQKFSVKPPKLKASKCIVFHRVTSRIMYKLSANKTMIPVHEIASQYDISEYLQEDLLYNNKPISEAQLIRIATEQIYRGEDSVSRLDYEAQETIQYTSFVTKLSLLDQGYVDFTPDDCHIPQ